LSQIDKYTPHLNIVTLTICTKKQNSALKKKNIGTQGVQELFFGELQAPGGSSTKFTLNSYDKVNPTSSFGYHVLRKKKKK